MTGINNSRKLTGLQTKSQGEDLRHCQKSSICSDPKSLIQLRMEDWHNVFQNLWKSSSSYLREGFNFSENQMENFLGGLILTESHCCWRSNTCGGVEAGYQEVASRADKTGNSESRLSRTHITHFPLPARVGVSTQTPKMKVIQLSINSAGYERQTMKNTVLLVKIKSIRTVVHLYKALFNISFPPNFLKKWDRLSTYLGPHFTEGKSRLRKNR